MPIVPGTTEPVATRRTTRCASPTSEIGFPVAVKAAGGGGGKGFRVALAEEELQDAFEGASREGEKFFSDATVYLERYLPDPAPRRGAGAGRPPRQRDPPRRARLLDPAPPPEADRGVARRPSGSSTPQLRERIGQIGVEAARAVDYVGAGTIEGLFSAGEGDEPEYFFLEMNTRVQVEHCVTEMTTGIDIVKEGIRAAAGEQLSYAPGGRRAARARDRVPDQRRGRLQELRPGAGQDRRLPRAERARACASTRACEAGGEVSPMYDPMVAKLIVWDADREQATSADAARARRIRDRGPEDADPVPPGAARDRAVGAGRDLPRPARGHASG